MLISAIISEIISELGMDATDSVNSTLLLGFMKGALRKAPVFMKDRKFLAEGTVTLAAGSNTADLTTLTNGLITERFVWYVSTDSKRVPIYKYNTLPFFHELYTTIETGKPFYYRIYGKTIQFDKKADTAITIGFDYFKEISSILSTDTFLGDEQMVELIKELTKAAYLLDYDEDGPRAAAHIGIAQEMIKALDSKYMLDELPNYLEDN